MPYVREKVYLAKYSPFDGSTVNSLILYMKDKRNGELFDYVAAHMAKAAEKRGVVNRGKLVVNVPREPNTIIIKGFDQAEELAKRVASLCELEYISPLSRKNSPHSQKYLSYDERFEHVKGIYSVKADMIEKIAGRDVILIDDIITTGATANECAKQLVKNGANKVDCVFVGQAEFYSRSKDKKK